MNIEELEKLLIDGKNINELSEYYNLECLEIIGIIRDYNLSPAGIDLDDPNWEYENLLNVVHISYNKTNTLENIGVSTAGGNYITLKKYCKFYGIEVITKYRKGGGNGNILIPDDVLIEHSYASTKNIKNMIIREKLLEYKCSNDKCNIIDEWCGKSIVLHLDHINGINTDHRLTNLRFLCPNCHSQTSTYAGRNMKKTERIKKPKRIPMKKPVRFMLSSGFSNLQVDCHLKMRKVERPPFDLLLKDIEELGYSGTGRKYGVSDNAIRKWVKNYNLDK